MFRPISITCLALALVTASLVWADDPRVIDADIRKTSEGTFTISATLKHADEGWDHYANGWQVETTSGEVLSKRILHHPHVEEQPFTRSKSGIKIPKEVKTVIIRAEDNVHGLGDETVELKVPH